MVTIALTATVLATVALLAITKIKLANIPANAAPARPIKTAMPLPPASRAPLAITLQIASVSYPVLGAATALALAGGTAVQRANTNP